MDKARIRAGGSPELGTIILNTPGRSDNVKTVGGGNKP